MAWLHRINPAHVDPLPDDGFDFYCRHLPSTQKPERGIDVHWFLRRNDKAVHFAYATNIHIWEVDTRPPIRWWIPFGIGVHTIAPDHPACPWFVRAIYTNIGTGNSALRALVTQGDVGLYKLMKGVWQRQ